MGFKFRQIGILQDVPNNIEIDSDGITVRNFLECLSNKYKKSIVNEILDQNNEMKPEYVMLLNGKNIFEIEGLDTVIPSNSVLMLTVQIFGG